MYTGKEVVEPKNEKTTYYLHAHFRTDVEIVKLK